MRRRGALLLEVVLALAIFVGAGLAVLGAVERAVGSAEYVRDLHVAADLARSAISGIEVGLEDPIAMNGPVRSWEEGEGTGAGNGWELRVEVSPAPFDGLTLVAVTAQREGGVRPVSCTLRQLVRLPRSAGGEP